MSAKSPASTIQVRVARDADAPAIANVINAAFTVERFFVSGDRITTAGVVSLIKQGVFLVAEADGVLLGCVYVEPKGERAYLGLLSVDPTSQNLGIGRRLMQDAENHARSARCRFVDLKVVNLRDGLTGFYRDLGYNETGTSDFPKEVLTSIPCHFILMSKPIS